MGNRSYGLSAPSSAAEDGEYWARGRMQTLQGYGASNARGGDKLGFRGPWDLGPEHGACGLGNQKEPGGTTTTASRPRSWG